MTKRQNAQPPAIRKFLAASPDLQVAELRNELLTAAVHERWSVKTGADPDAQALVGSVPRKTDIVSLRAQQVPAALPSDGRSGDVERTIWQVDAMLVSFAHEQDQDYHLVLSDIDQNTMIAEIPDPESLSPGSFFSDQISAAREAFTDHFNLEPNSVQLSDEAGVAAAFAEVSARVSVTGIGFFDFIHGQRGVAPNGIELHPVLDISFIP